MRTQLLLAFRVLLRRRFFTFITLFGISFTIMALVVITAMADATLGENPPLGNRDRLVFASLAFTENMVPDTTYLVDSAAVEGRMVYDSTEQIGERKIGSGTGGVAYYAYDKYMRELQYVDAATHTNPTATFDTYLDGRKITFITNFTDDDYWRVFDFDFRHGSPFSAEQLAAGERVAVMSADAAREYFGGAGAEAIGRTLPLGDDDFRVVGLVETPATNFYGLDADVFVPRTSVVNDLTTPAARGGGAAVFLATDAASRDAVKAELERVGEEFEPIAEDDANRFTFEGLTFLEETAHSYAFASDDRGQSLRTFIPIVGTLLLLLIALPSLNLVNVNFSRVYERAPEIAVRKSFGATDGDIARQFVVETLVVTVTGAILGIALAIGAIGLVNAEGYLGNVRLAFTPTVAAVAVGLILLLTLLTGVLPALRFARAPIASSLR